MQTRPRAPSGCGGCLSRHGGLGGRVSAPGGWGVEAHRCSLASACWPIGESGLSAATHVPRHGEHVADPLDWLVRERYRLQTQKLPRGGGPTKHRTRSTTHDRGGAADSTLGFWDPVRAPPAGQDHRATSRCPTHRPRQVLSFTALLHRTARARSKLGSVRRWDSGLPYRVPGRDSASATPRPTRRSQWPP